MIKFYVRWRINPNERFKTGEEREKSVLHVLEDVKADMQAGLIKDFGSCVDGTGGYAIYEVPSEADVFASLRRWTPYVLFDARQVLTVEQLLESRKGPVQAGKQIS